MRLICNFLGEALVDKSGKSGCIGTWNILEKSVEIFMITHTSLEKSTFMMLNIDSKVHMEHRFFIKVSH